MNSALTIPVGIPLSPDGGIMGDIIIDGDVHIKGSITVDVSGYFSTQTVFTDNIIDLNYGAISGVAAGEAGIIVQRGGGAYPNTGLLFDEAQDAWKMYWSGESDKYLVVRNGSFTQNSIPYVGVGAGLNEDPNNFVYLPSSKCVGIGTNSPTDSLTVVAASGSTISVSSTDNSVKTILNSDTTGNVGTVSNTDLQIITNNVDRITVKNDGKVGIGKASPSEFLDVVGNITTNGTVAITHISGSATLSNTTGLFTIASSDTNKAMDFGAKTASNLKDPILDQDGMTKKFTADNYYNKTEVDAKDIFETSGSNVVAKAAHTDKSWSCGVPAETFAIASYSNVGANLSAGSNFYKNLENLDVTTGGTASADSVYNGTVPVENAFDKNDGTQWASLNGAGVHYCQYTTTDARTATTYRIFHPATYYLKDWELRGSNDNFSTHTVLDAVTGSSATNIAVTYNIDSPAPFKAYRLHCTDFVFFASVNELTLNAPYATWSNTLDTGELIASGTKAIAPATLVIKDEAGNAVNGATVNVSYDLNNTGYTAMMTVNAFKALSAAMFASTTSLKFQIAPIDGQKIGSSNSFSIGTASGESIITPGGEIYTKTNAVETHRLSSKANQTALDAVSAQLYFTASGTTNISASKGVILPAISGQISLINGTLRTDLLNGTSNTSFISNNGISNFQIEHNTTGFVNLRNTGSDADTHGFKFKGDTRDLLTINNAGCLGLGTAPTTNPLTIQVNGNGLYSVQLRNMDTSSNAAGARYEVSNGANSLSVEAWNAGVANISGSRIAKSNVIHGSSEVGLHLASINASGTNSLKLFCGTTESQDSERMRITNDGKIGIGTKSPSTLCHIAGTLTTNTIVLSGGQIQFPATAIPSSDANTLDDYEEGTWMPELSFGSGQTGSFTYQTQTGTYTKIGDFVHIGCLCTWEAIPSAGTILVLSGLPFAAGASILPISSPIICDLCTGSWTGNAPTAIRITNSNTTAAFVLSTVSNSIYYDQANIPTALRILFSASYKVN